MSYNSRTGLRLELMREQSLRQQQQNMQNLSQSSSSSNPSSGISPPESFSSKSQPIIINQPIRFTGSRLVHLPPQIIHQVQKQQQQQCQMDGVKPGGRVVTMSVSVPVSSMTMTNGDDMNFVGPTISPKTRQAPSVIDSPRRSAHYTAPHSRGRVQSHNQQSPAELSPDLGHLDSPQSASFTSAQSELDEIIIDEILSLEDDRRKLQQQEGGGRSYVSRNDSLDRMAIVRKISSSAPTSSIDIEQLVHDEMVREQELLRDRRKKDIHNMIERRRRYNINDRIKELGTLLPKTCTEDSKLNKGTILKASVDYIKALQRETVRLHQNSQQPQPDDEKAKLLAHIQELERELQQHGLPVPAPPQIYSSSPSSGSRPPPVPLQQIKQEPPDQDLDDDTVTGYSPQSDVSSSYSAMSNRFFDTTGASSPPLFSPTQQQAPPYPQMATVQDQQQQFYSNSPANVISGSYPPHGATYFGVQQPQQAQQQTAPVYAQLSTRPPTTHFEPLSVYVPPNCGVMPADNRGGQVYGGAQQHHHQQQVLQQQRSLPHRTTTCHPQQQQPHRGLKRDGSDDSGRMGLFGTGGQPSPVLTTASGNVTTDFKDFLLRDPMISESRLSPAGGTGLSSPEVHWDSGTFSPGSPSNSGQERMDQN